AYVALVEGDPAGQASLFHHASGIGQQLGGQIKAGDMADRAYGLCQHQGRQPDAAPGIQPAAGRREPQHLYRGTKDGFPKRVGRKRHLYEMVDVSHGSPHYNSKTCSSECLVASSTMGPLTRRPTARPLPLTTSSLS